MNEIEMLPPQNLEAERAVLGSCLIERQAVSLAVEVLPDPSWFYRSAHREIFAATMELHRRNEPVDLITLGDELERQGKMEDVGGSSFLMELFESTPTAANVEYHAKIVRDKHVRRAGIETARRLLHHLWAEEHEVIESLQKATGDLLQLSLSDTDDRVFSAKELLREWAPCLEDGPTRQRSVKKSGFAPVDHIIGGFADGELQYWGAGPGSGKTTGMLQSAIHIARQGEPVLALSMELGRQRVSERLISIDTRTPGSVIQYGPQHLFDAALPNIFQGISRVEGLPLYIAFQRRSTAWAERQAKEIMSRHGRKLGALFVDRLEKWSDKDVATQDPRHRISRLSDRTSALAANLDVPVICLVQLNRAGQKSETPSMDAFRDSGDIEQDCQVGIVIRSEKPASSTDRTPLKSVWHIVKANDCGQGECDPLVWFHWIPFFGNPETRQPEPYWMERD